MSTPASLPLASVRIADFTWAVAGPTATMILGALGAQVIKIESSKRPDVTRRNAHANATVNRDKLSVTLNLQSTRGVELARELAQISDVVASSFRPGVMESLGLGYERLKQLKNDVIVLSCSMAGLNGPMAPYSGYAPMFVALSGLGELTGYADGPPTQIRTGADIIAGVDGAFAVVAALLARELHGGGTLIDLSAIEAQTALIGEAVLDYLLTTRTQHRSGNDEPQSAPHNCYRCRGTDQWVSIVVADDEEWKRFSTAIGLPLWSTEKRFETVPGRVANVRELDALIGGWTSQQESEDIVRILQAQGVAAISSYNSSALFADEHVIARELVSYLPNKGGEDMPLVRLGGRRSGVPLTPQRPGPEVGEHNHYVLGELLGYSTDQIEKWETEEVVV